MNFKDPIKEQKMDMFEGLVCKMWVALLAIYIEFKYKEENLNIYMNPFPKNFFGSCNPN